MGGCSSKGASGAEEPKLNSWLWVSTLEALSRQGDAAQADARARWAQWFGSNGSQLSNIPSTVEMYGGRYVSSLMLSSIFKGTTNPIVAEAELLVLASHPDLQSGVATSKRLHRLLELAASQSTESNARIAAMCLVLSMFDNPSTASSCSAALREAGALQLLPELLGRRMESDLLQTTAMTLLHVLCKEPKNAELLGALQDDSLPIVLSCVADAARRPYLAAAALDCITTIAAASVDAKAAVYRATPFVYLARCIEGVLEAGMGSHGSLACLVAAVRCCKLLAGEGNTDDLITSGVVRSLLQLGHLQSAARSGLGAASGTLHSRLSFCAVQHPRWLRRGQQPQQLAVLMHAQAAWEQSMFASASSAASSLVKTVLAAAPRSATGVWSQALKEEASASTRALYAVNLLERALSSASGLSVGQILPLLDRLLDMLLARGASATSTARRRIAPLAWRAMHTIAYNAYCVNIGSTRRSKLVASSSSPRGGGGGLDDGASVFSAADTVMSHATTTNPGVLKARSLYMFRLLWEEGFYTGDEASRAAAADAAADSADGGSTDTEGLTSLQELLARVSQLTQDITVKRKGTVRFDSMQPSGGGDAPPAPPSLPQQDGRGEEAGSPVRRATPTPLLVPSAPVWSEDVPSMVMQLAMLAEALCSSSPPAKGANGTATPGPHAPSAPPQPPTSPAASVHLAARVGSPSSVASPPAVPPSPASEPMPQTAPWPSVQDNAEQAKQVRTLLGYGIMWLNSYALRQVDAPAADDIQRVVSTASAALDSLHTESSKRAVRSAGLRSFGVRWKQWQMPLLSRMCRSSLPEVSAFASICLRDAMLQLAAVNAAAEDMHAFPTAQDLQLVQGRSKPSGSMGPRQGAAVTGAPPSPSRQGLSDIARAVSGLDSLKFRGAAPAMSPADSGAAPHEPVSLEVPALCLPLAAVPPLSPQDATQWSKALYPACDAIPWAVRMQIGHDAASATAAALPSSLAQLQAWQDALAASDAAADQAAQALREQLEALGVLELLDRAVRDESRSTGCVVAGCDAVCREVTLQCRLALRAQTAPPTGSGGGSAAAANKKTPSKQSKKSTSTMEVVSPFMLAVE